MTEQTKMGERERRLRKAAAKGDEFAIKLLDYFESGKYGITKCYHLWGLRDVLFGEPIRKATIERAKAEEVCPIKRGGLRDVLFLVPTFEYLEDERIYQEEGGK